MQTETRYYATGKRKTSIARTWLKPGTGAIIVNNLPVEQYFPIETTRLELMQPLKLTKTDGAYDVTATVKGGGTIGQASAIRHGITRALISANPDFRAALKKAGFVKRDPRVKERKKYGQKSARARFQFSKR
ncbi:MAG TPA: 30S ribosomal protein S9 [Desulfobacterales bacterium]|jgi:small subunit ribosomal protein S9|nr:MAG: 30S ribosomal protein S9 [Syntrophobacterales bacterium]HSO63349.1 30S ribosomal protein S9 [Desulfobacterales bacterium]